MSFSALRVLGGLAERAKGFQLFPSTIGFVQPLIPNFPLVDQVLPAFPAGSARSTAGIHGHHFDIHDHASRRAVGLHCLAFQVQVSLSARSNPGGDDFHGFLLPFAHRNRHRRGVLILNGHQTIARHDGNALPAAGNAKGSLGHPPSHSPVHGYVVEVLCPLFTTAAFDFQELLEIFHHIFHFQNSQQFDLPSGAVVIRCQAFRVEVQHLPREREARPFADLQELDDGSPHWGALWVPQGQGYLEVLVLWVRLLFLDVFNFQIHQVSLLGLCLQVGSFGRPALMARLQSLLFLDISFH
mmetsp:Transcript_82593/g.130593  ORF Transcript_82593/g.130593 Transcript_82593/m.130593 type:complete len:298 (-) Transcript_82593:368-1261(-)